MKAGAMAVGWAVFALAISPPDVEARGIQWKGTGGWGKGAAYNRMYDPGTVETVRGDVLDLERITPMKGMSAGIHMRLKVDQETLSVHLGPEWYIQNQDLKLDAGDKVVVKGSRIVFEGAPALIAAEVQKGGEVLMLRDESGLPSWSAVRRR